MVPETWQGKVIASFCALLGISFFALPAVSNACQNCFFNEIAEFAAIAVNGSAEKNCKNLRPTNGRSGFS